MNFNNFFEPISVGCNINILRKATKIELYNKIHHLETDSEVGRLCSICQQNYKDDEIIRNIIHCKHFYHQQCIDEWFENNTKCPECQYDIRNYIQSNDNTPINTATNTPRQSYFRSSNTIPLYSFVLPQQQNSQSNETPPQQPINELLRNILNNINSDDNDISSTFIDIQYLPQQTSHSTTNTNNQNPNNQNHNNQNHNNQNHNNQNTNNIPNNIPNNNTNPRTQNQSTSEESNTDNDQSLNDNYNLIETYNKITQRKIRKQDDKISKLEYEIKFLIRKMRKIEINNKYSNSNEDYSSDESSEDSSEESSSDSNFNVNYNDRSIWSYLWRFS